MARILIVDDDEVIRLILGEFLGARGHECASASDVAQARRYFKRTRFDLVISDLNMPGESGLDLLRYLALHAPALPFILMSADDDRRVRTKSMEMGACAFLTKPFRISELQSIITRVLCARPHRSQNEPLVSLVPCTA